jgi:hypothetical protein
VKSQGDKACSLIRHFQYGRLILSSLFHFVLVLGKDFFVAQLKNSSLNFSDFGFQ